MSNRTTQTLPPKEMALFRKTVRYYEQKQYKMALRCTKQILSNSQFSEHGETLAMRGLILNCVGKHDEALEVVRRGLHADLRSYVCWHVFGQVQRSDKKYDEAIKAYKQALRLDNDNLQILRDLSLLQIQLRDFVGYRDSRYQLLVLRPGNKAHWVAYANACHMLGDYDMALRIIDDFLKNMEVSDNNESEHADLVYYKVTILVDAGRLQNAFDCLETNCVNFADKLTFMETRADLLFKLGRLADSEDVYKRLLDRNANCLDYMKCIEEIKRKACEGDADAKSVTKKFYEELQAKFPRNRVIKGRALAFMEREEFQQKLLAYLIDGLRSGLPSLFNCICVFYTDYSKISFIEEVLVNFVRMCEQDGYNAASLDNSPDPELPTTIVWVYYFLAQHFLRLQRHDTALQYVSKAIEHTPTLVDLYTMKAKIYRKAGQPREASDEMVYAQRLDTADRYLNCKCTKYLLEAGNIEEAAEMCERFTREGMASDDALYEMQCLWYPLACAKAYYQRKLIGEALKRCHQVERTLTAYYEEQYDFHTYCVRKCYMAPYVSMLQYLDHVHNTPYYTKVAKIAACIYLELYDNPQLVDDKPKSEASDITAAEQRKLRRKANKQKALEEKANEETTKNNKQANAKKRNDLGDGEFVESAPLDPKKLVRTTTPLDDAAKFLHPLLFTQCADVGLYTIAFDIYERKQKLLLMLKCVKRIATLTESVDKVKELRTRFDALYDQQKERLAHTTVASIEDLLLTIAPGSH